MAARVPIDILVVGHDGRRLFCLRLHARALWVALALMLITTVAAGIKTTAGRPQIHAAVAIPVDSTLREQPCEMLALVEQRLPALESEISALSEAQASIRKLFRVRQTIIETAERAETGGSEALLASQLDRLLMVIHAEAKNVRALEPFVAQAARALAGLPSRWPVRAAITSQFGQRLSPWSRTTEFHEGIDLAARPGTRVLAPSDGRVALVGNTPEYGNTVDLDHGNHIRTRFGHLERVTVAMGQQVERGQPIAISGNTGRTTGPHLHYEVIVRGRPVDPRPYLSE